MKTQIRFMAFGPGFRQKNIHAAVSVWWLLVLFCAGLLVGGFLLKRTSHPTASPASVAEPLPTETVLAGVTQEVLQRSERGVEIHFYRLLNDGPGAESLQAFAARTQVLIDEFVRISEGRIAANFFTDTSSGPARAAALAEGLAPLRFGRSEPDLLGIVVRFRSDKVVLSPLDPKWEGALEFDLTRALARVMGQVGTGDSVMNPAPMNAAATAELFRILPDLETLTLEQARQQLQAAAREEFKVVVTALQQQLAEAQQRFATSGNSTAGRQELQQLQFQQMEKLNEIPRRTQAQLDLLARIKK